MARGGPVIGVWRTRVAMSEVMEWSSQILPGLGPPVQILPQHQALHLSSASTSCSTILSSHFQPCRRVRQHSSHTIRSDSLPFPSLWPKETFKDAFNLSPTSEPKRTVDVQSYSAPFDEFPRPTRNYPSLVIQLTTALERQFPSGLVDQSRTRDLNAPENFDQSTSSSTSEIIQPGSKPSSKPLPTVTTISEHRSGRERVPDPRFETCDILGKQPLPRSSNRIACSNSNPNSSKQIEAGVESNNVVFNQTVRRSPDGGAHLSWNSHATQMSYKKSGTRVEPANIVVNQARSSHDGAHLALNVYPIPASRIVGSVIRQTSGVPKAYNPSLQRVQQELDVYRDQWRLQKMAAELYGREAQSAQPAYRGEAEALAGYQGVRGHGNNVAQLEALLAQTRPGAAQWRAAAKMIEQKRNPSRKVVCGIDSRQQNTDSLKVELERAGDVKANATRSIAANHVLEIREPEPLSREEEDQSSAFSEEGVPENSLRQDLITEELVRKAHWMDCRSTPAWMKAGLNLIGQGGLQSRASCGSRDCSRNSAQGIDSTDMHSAGTLSKATAVLQNRLQQGIATDSYTYVKVLQMCSKQKDLLAAKQVHACIIQSGMDKDLYVSNTLLHVYISCGDFLNARRVFDKLEKKSVIAWNAMLAGYARSDASESALELFNLMGQDGPRPNEVTYVCILKGCATPLALKWGKQVHECIREAGFESDMRVGTALIQMYAKSGCIDGARLVFDRMEKRDVVTWNVMIGAYAESGRGVEAYRLFLQMRREGFQPNAITFISILNASASEGASEWVKEVHDHASQAGLESDLRVGNALVHMYAESGSIDDARLVFDRMEKRDVVTWTAMIGGLAQHGCGHEAYRLFLQMSQEGFQPNAITYMSILNASASAGALEWVKEVHGHASKAGLESDLRVGTALVHMYAKSGSIDDARRVFDRMKKHDVVTWNAMMGGLAQHGFGHDALELFRKMNADGVKANGNSFVAVLSACCHGGFVDVGRRLFSAMTQDYGIEPDIVHYTCMVDLLGRAGQLEEAKLFISDMPVKPSEVTWKALLGACRTYGDVELGELAAKEILKLEPNDSSAYVLLSNIYAAAGKWEKVSLVRTMMQDRGVRKEPGRSWIEVDNKIHEFVVGDTSHPEAMAIYTELNILTEKLKAEGYIPDTRFVLHDINEEDKELALCSHSEKLAIAYGLIHIPREEPIRVTKNLRVCPDCHTATKIISKVTGREIIARDTNRFHHFKDGVCSCGDYW